MVYIIDKILYGIYITTLELNRPNSSPGYTKETQITIELPFPLCVTISGHNSVQKHV